MYINIYSYTQRYSHDGWRSVLVRRRIFGEIEPSSAGAPCRNWSCSSGKQDQLRSDDETSYNGLRCTTSNSSLIYFCSPSFSCVGRTVLMLMLDLQRRYVNILKII